MGFIFIYYIQLIICFILIYLFIRKLYLLEVMFLDLLIKLKRGIINLLDCKLSIPKRFSISVTWNILCILPCSVNFMFTTLQH